MSELESKNIKEREIKEITLPEIPENSVRLTHFTSERVAKKLIEKGEPFRYKAQLDSTTDAFSSNDQVRGILVNKKTGAFHRETFGNAVVIMDLDIQEHKMRLRAGAYLDQDIPNHNILGYILTDDLNSLKENADYNPIKNTLKPNPNSSMIGEITTQKGEIKIVKPEIDIDESSSDIW